MFHGPVKDIASIRIRPSRVAFAHDSYTDHKELDIQHREVQTGISNPPDGHKTNKTRHKYNTFNHLLAVLVCRSLEERRVGKHNQEIRCRVLTLDYRLSVRTGAFASHNHS